MNGFGKHVVNLVAAFSLAVFASLAGAGEVVEVSIVKMTFTPQHIKIEPGTTVKWVNKEKRNNHSVYFEQEGLAESDRFFPGESWQRTFDKPGLYPYVCGPHPEMTGVVEVVK
jgi:plastocyanin